MKFDTPHGSVFGGYGFWTYSATPDSPPSSGNGNLPTPAAAERSALSLRALFEHARRMLRRTQD
jgi:hypothetical protein